MELSELFLPFELANNKYLKDYFNSRNEKCIAWYNTDGPVDNIKTPILASFPSNWNVYKDRINAPLWQHVWDFYKNRFKLHSSVTLDKDGYKIIIVNFADIVNEEHTRIICGFKTELEANTERLKKLIQYTT